MWLVKAWVDAVKFNLEAQSVVAMRLMKIAVHGPTGAASKRMVQEKSEVAAAAFTAGGRSVTAATKAAMVPVKKRVRANRKRLSGGK